MTKSVRQVPRSHAGINLGETDPVAHELVEEKLFGFWIFLMSDAILFAILFATYVTMTPNTASGPTGAQLFDLRSVFVQTLLLLFSSFTMGMAAITVKYARPLLHFYVWMAVTLALALGFLGLELRDFVAMLEAGASPGRSGYLSSFWGLVPLHGLHVVFGCLWLIVMLAQVRAFGPAPFVKTRLLRLGLFWHFLDLVWIGIFSVVFLRAFI